MGLLGEIGKALLSEVLSSDETKPKKWRVFPCCSATTETKDIVKLLLKWDEIFQRKDFFQDMRMTPIRRQELVYNDMHDCHTYLSDPNNSEEYNKMPGPENVLHPSDGWVCELKDGGTIFITIKDWLEYNTYKARDEDPAHYEYSLSSSLADGAHCNIGRYKEEFVRGDIFRTYYFHYKPKQNDTKYLTFLVTTGDCCGGYKGYLSSEYVDFIVQLYEDGWYNPPASMYVGYGDETSAIYSYLTALRYNGKFNDPFTRNHYGNKPYGEVRNCNGFFQLLSEEEWIQEIDVHSLYQHLEEFVTPVCKEIERINILNYQKFQDTKKRKQEEKEAEQQREEEEARRLEEEKRKEQQREKNNLNNSLDSI